MIIEVWHARRSQGTVPRILSLRTSWT